MVKIIFVASVNGKEKQKFFYLSIINILKNLGNDVYYEHIIKETPKSLSSSHSKNIKYHKKVIRKIHKSDCIIAEITHESVSVGYLIHEALKMRKPVLAISRLDIVPNLSMFLENFQSFTFVPYKKIFELEKTLPKIMKNITVKKQKKFNFFLSEELDIKLKTLADKNNTSKSAFLRSLLESL